MVPGMQQNIVNSYMTSIGFSKVTVFKYHIFVIWIFFRITAVMNHVQTLYFLESMVTKLHFQILSIEHNPGYNYDAVENHLK